MNNIKACEVNWIVRWVYTKEEWHLFLKWQAKHKGIFNYLWYSIFYRNKQIESVELTEKWIKIGDKKKYFNGPVTELRKVGIYDKKHINVMNIVYEVISKNQLSEIIIPIPRGKLKEAIEAQEKLNEKLFSS
ncbi:MAG TPA: hypothetical protein VGQ09_00330 [Chitinophagaceae bacterium]|jgi:hypothetical protein|nr:hypothetical protein [Chitinophagaceae bacterium]